MRYAAVIVVLLTTSLCYAEESFFDKHETSIFTSVYTKHFKGSEGQNERNNALSIMVDQWFITTFENSKKGRSWLVGRRFSTDKFELWETGLHIRATLYAGGLYGYGDDMPDIAGWTIGAVPGLEIGHKESKLSLTTLIAPFDGGVMVVLIGYTF